MAAERSYPASKVSGCREETPRVRGQGLPGEATSHPRPGVVTLRSHPEPEARGSGWEEQPHIQGAVAVGAQECLEELSHIESQERRW